MILQLVGLLSLLASVAQEVEVGRVLRSDRGAVACVDHYAARIGAEVPEDHGDQSVVMDRVAEEIEQLASDGRAPPTPAARRRRDGRW